MENFTRYNQFNEVISLRDTMNRLCFLIVQKRIQ